MTYLERLRIQMEYAVPLIRDLQRILGPDIVNDALAHRSESVTSAPGSKADFSRMQAGAEHFVARLRSHCFRCRQL
jgi:hypothetical protein